VFRILTNNDELSVSFSSDWIVRLVGLRPGGFGLFILIVIYEALIAISLGLAISAFAPTVGES
jgi:hypothetical protein